MPPRVLVTRSVDQSSALAGVLRARGAEPVLVPVLEITEPSSYEILDQALAHLGSFHWLIFTSGNAVNAFAKRRKMPLPPAATPLPHIAAIGSATAHALESVGLHPSLVPPRAVAESLATALLPHARQPDGAPTRFLLLRAEQAREHLPDSLRAAGAEVTIAPAYRTVIPQDSVDLLRHLFSSASGTDGSKPLSHRIDAITFTSSSSVHNLLALSSAAGIDLPDTALRISIGPITSQTLRDLELPPHAEAPEATVDSLADTVLSALAADRDR